MNETDEILYRRFLSEGNESDLGELLERHEHVHERRRLLYRPDAAVPPGQRLFCTAKTTGSAGGSKKL